MFHANFFSIKFQELISVYDSPVVNRHSNRLQYLSTPNEHAH